MIEKNCIIRHPNDCSKYVKCNDGSAYEISCEKGKKWNHRKNRCDKPENYDCNPKITNITTPEPPCSYICPKQDLKTGCKVSMCLSLSKSDPRKCIKCVPNSDGSGTPFVKYCPDGEL